MTTPLLNAARSLLLLLAALAWPGLASADDPPALPSGEYVYTITHSARGNIGTLFVELKQTGDTIEAKSSRHIQVKVLGVTVYRDTSHLVQSLKAGKLQSLNRETDENGTKSALSITLDGGALVAKADGQQWQLDADLLPTSSWNRAVLDRDKLIDTKSGKEISVTTESKGTTEIAAGGKRFEANHYSQRGGVNRELWFDDAGVFVRQQMERDDATITITLVRAP